MKNAIQKIIEHSKSLNHEAFESLEMIEEITQTIPDLITIHDITNNQVIFSNGNDLSSRLHDSGEIYKMNDGDRAIIIIHPDDQERAATFLQERRLLDGSNIAEVELRLQAGNWIRIRSKVFRRDEQGSATQIISVTTDITERKKAEHELLALKEALTRDATGKYLHLFNSIDEGFYVAEVLFDENNRPIDVYYHEENPAAVRIVGVSVKGKTLTEVSPDYERYWYEIFGGVALTGESKRLEQYSRHDNQWFNFYVTKIGDEHTRLIAILFQDVTDLKRAQHELEQHKDLLQSVFDVSTNGLSVLKSIRNEAGEIVDMQYLFANETTKRTNNRYDLEGKLYSELHAGFKGTDYFSVVKQVAETGEPHQYQLHYNFEHLDHWYNITTVKLNDGVVISFEDISDTKKAEVVLRESEERKAFLLKLTDAIGSLSDAHKIQAVATEIAMNYFGADRCYYCEIENDTAIIRRDTSKKGLPSVAGSYPLSSMPIFKAVLKGGCAFVVNDCNTTDFMDESLRQLCIQMQILSYINVPVIKHGQPAGILCLTQCTPRVWTSNEVDLVNELAERLCAALERVNAEQAVAADLRDTQILQKLSEHLVSEENTSVIYEQIMDAAIQLTNADAGTVQIVDEDTNELLLLASKGLEEKVTSKFNFVSAASNTSCGLALANKQRTFVDYDVPAAEDPDGSLQLHLDAGFLSAQSTPLISRSGKPIGMVSTHWRQHYRPTERQLRFLDLLARQAADLVDQRQAQEVVRESREKYKSLFNSINQGFGIAEMIFDEQDQLVDYKWLEVNAQYEQLLGLSMAPLLSGKTVREVYPDQFDTSWRQVFAKVALTGEPSRFDQYSPYVDRWLDMYVFKTGSPEDRCIAILFDDITQRKRREANMRFLTEVTEEFSRLSSLDEIMQIVGEKIGTYMKVDNCSFVDIDETAEKEMIPAFNWYSSGVRSFPQAFTIRDYLSEEFETASRAGKTIVVRDTKTDHRTNAAGYDALLVNAFIVVPFFRDSEWKYFLACSTEQPRAWRQDEVELFEELAGRLFPRIEKARSEIALQKSEEKYRSLFETMDEGFAICELLRNDEGHAVDFRYIELNRAIEQQAGLNLKAIIGKRSSEVLPGLEGWWLETFQRVVDSGKMCRFDHYVAPLNQWFDVTVFPQEGERFATLFDDITDRKQWEQEQAEFSARLEKEVAVRTKELADEQYFLEQITDNTPHLIYVFDFDEERFIYINRRMEALTGITQDHVYGMGPHLLKQVLHVDDLGRRINYMYRLSKLNEGEIRENEFRLKVGDGYRWFRSKDHIFKKQNGKVKQVIGLAEDVTYEIQLQEKMQNDNGGIALN
jgi:PAS domain S-box-containing protein